ncbi:hypothetical protein ABZX93_18145 [Streptomyces sp. NPDC006632]|uniref:hypothetical protein n=1 Tax=Streptomyces sp. NPDC006632 TaxID=3157182 RepID=UPI0033A208C9
MSSEHTQDEPRQRRSRRSPLVLAAAAVAVLAAGGGGAYWATTASSGGGGTPGKDGAPPPLALDSAPGGGSGTGSDGGTGTGKGNGIAPGEPDPNGVVYRASVKLPGGPGKASVYQPHGTVSEAEVHRLAQALGVDGAARLEDGTWKVGATKDGSGPTLTVSQKAPGTWSFARFGSGGTDNCPKGKMCPMHTTGADTDAGTSGGADGGAPVSEQAAKAAAAPVLKALGQDDAKLDAKEVLASARVVNADPVLDGLPTYGWTTGIQVGSGGQVVGGSGQLKALDKGATYPVMGAEQTLAQLNSHATGRPKAKDCTGPVPLDGQPTKGRLPSDPQGNIQQPCKQPTPSAVTVDGAVFGLAAQSVGGVQSLVPSWLFQVKPDAGQAFTVTAPAVAPPYVTKPPASPTGAPVPAPSGSATAPGAHGQALASYALAPDGRTLTVTFWGGVCSTYTATADESGDGVRVKVTGQARQDPKKMCIALAKQQTVQVELHESLGARTVIDADTGKELPKK